MFLFQSEHSITDVDEVSGGLLLVLGRARSNSSWHGAKMYAVMYGGTHVSRCGFPTLKRGRSGCTSRAIVHQPEFVFEVDVGAIRELYTEEGIVEDALPVSRTVYLQSRAQNILLGGCPPFAVLTLLLWL